MSIDRCLYTVGVECLFVILVFLVPDIKKRGCRDSFHVQDGTHVGVRVANRHPVRGVQGGEVIPVQGDPAGRLDLIAVITPVFQGFVLMSQIEGKRMVGSEAGEIETPLYPCRIAVIQILERSMLVPEG